MLRLCRRLVHLFLALIPAIGPPETWKRRHPFSWKLPGPRSLPSYPLPAAPLVAAAASNRFSNRVVETRANRYCGTALNLGACTVQLCLWPRIFFDPGRKVRQGFFLRATPQLSLNFWPSRCNEMYFSE